MPKRTPEKTKKKSNFIFSDFGILLICCLGRVYLHKNSRNICVAICFGFTKKIFSLLRLANYLIPNFGRGLEFANDCSGSLYGF